MNQILKRQTSRFHYGSKVPAVTITVFITILERQRRLICHDYSQYKNEGEKWKYGNVFWPPQEKYAKFRRDKTCLTLWHMVFFEIYKRCLNMQGAWQTLLITDYDQWSDLSFVYSPLLHSESIPYLTSLAAIWVEACESS